LRAALSVGSLRSRDRPCRNSAWLVTTVVPALGDPVRPGKPYRGRGASSIMGDDGNSKALVYIAVGALAAVGAGYLVWKYGMTDESRRRTVTALNEARKKATETMKSVAAGAKDTMAEVSEQARDGATQVRAQAMRKAGEVGQRLRP
ncbi:MAG: hypothetical protein QOG31_679, partial [Thermoplasmata archaeon]|nr:hypothetical protein [Thermoplasmata archaeon]